MCVIQVEAQKGVALYLAFPMISAGAFATGKSPVDTAFSKDGAGAWTSLAIADTAAEIGSTGMYEIDLNATEMGHDQIVIKFTGASVDDLMVVLNMVPTPARLADGVAHGGTLGSSTATLALKAVNITSPDTGVSALKVSSQDAHGMLVEGAGTGSQGVFITAPSGVLINADTGKGLDISAQNSIGVSIQGDIIGLYVYANALPDDPYAAAVMVESDAGHAVSFAVDTEGDALHLEAKGTGHHGIFAKGGTNGDGFRGVGQGTGVGFVSSPAASGFGPVVSVHRS